MRTHYLPTLILVTLVGVSAPADPQRRGDFPGYGMVPKEDTGALEFLQQHPEYDGRGVIVAIFDTGVDPGAPGLQVTTDGKPKIVDIVDGSGSGDVDTSTVRQAEDGLLAGLSGRRLKIDPDWNNPTGEYHLGLRRGYELYPGGLVGRLAAKRREKWDQQQRAAVTALERQLAEWDAAHPSPDKPVAAGLRTGRKEREEIKLRLAQLNKLQDDYDDPGPIFDCVVFHDGEVWRAAIDTDEDGELADEKLMTNYRLERQYATFSDEDLMNFAVNIYDDGNLLSIVADSGAHGTHVAGVVAAYFPDRPELNGLAPGAQLVAVKIGDTRLGSTAVGTGEIRGCVAVLQNKCDLINMSFGGPTADPNQGRTIEIYSEIVNKQGVIFVSSAGNEGPALSTAGAPGSTTSAIFGIGAYISPDMQEVQYSLRETTAPRQYTFTSRGPNYDGDLGVKFSAPGGAIAPVPNWVLQGNMQMHGTSMAAPNACGNIALLLSGLKAQGIAYSPARIRRALENTAAPVPDVDVFALGRGLIRIDRAWDYLTEYADYADQDLRFELRVRSRGNARGIYLREPYEVNRPLDARVIITPLFHEDADNRDKVDFELRCKLEATAPWIECADYLMLMHGGRRLDIRVDPTDLPPGAHYAEIRGYDSSSPERGPVFRLPITVIRPVEVRNEGGPTWQESIHFEPGYEERHFLVVPEGATWADLHIRRVDDDGGEANVVVVQTVQLVPGYGYNDHQLRQYLRLGTEAEEVHSFKVVGGRTLELCVAEYTGYLGRGEVEVELSFHGIAPDREEIGLNGSELATRINIEAPLRKERVSPKGSLSILRRAVRPSKAEVRPLDGQRDMLPEERQVHELVLTYNFKMDKDGRVTPRVALSNFVDEKTWQSRMFMIFDSSKRLVHTGWLDPSPVRLSKGEHVLRFQVRHDDQTQLEKLKDMVLMLDYALSSPVGLECYTDIDDVIAGGSRFGTRTLPKGARALLYVASPAVAKLPKSAQPGDLLVGTMTFGNPNGSLLGSGKRPGGFPVTCVVPPKPTASNDGGSGGAGDDEDEQSEEQKLAEAVRDLKVARLARLHGQEHRELFDRLAAEILRDYPDHLPVLRAQLSRADGKQRRDDLGAVVAAADRVIAQIDQEALAAHYGVKLDPDDKAGAKVRKEMDKQKTVLTDALHRKAKALFDLAAKSRAEGQPEPLTHDAGNAQARTGPAAARSRAVGRQEETDDEAAGDDAFEQAYAQLQKWVDTTSGEYLTLHIEREKRHDRLGQALKLLNDKIAESKNKKDLYRRRIRLLGELGWSHWKRYEEQWLLIRFPAEYAPF